MEDEKIEEIKISEFAEADLDEIVSYHYSRSPNYVERIISEFEENVISLQKHPKRGRTVPELERQGITKYRELIQEYYRIIY